MPEVLVKQDASKNSPPASPAQGVAQEVNRVLGQSIPAAVLAKLNRRKFNTGQVSSQWFHCVLYGETDARKTTTAAMFGTPENTRIVLLRRKEQLIPLRALQYEAFLAETWEQAAMALQYPEAIWPEWARLADRTLVLDDITEGKDMAADDNAVNEEGKEIHDVRKIIRGAKEDIRPVIKTVLRKPMHFIVVAMARQWDQSDGEGRIAPDLPQSIANLITTDFEFVFYCRKGLWQLVTHEQHMQLTRRDEKGKKQPYTLTIFAKHKLPRELEGKGVIRPLEPMNLRAIWERVKNAAASQESCQETKDDQESKPPETMADSAEA